MGNEQPKKPKIVTSSELQTYVMIIQAKLTQSRNKKVLEIGKKRNEIRELLKEKGLELAKAKMETILQEEDTITVYDILGTLLEKIKEKCSYILYYDRCPEEIRATLDTIIYASCRLEIDEFHQFRNHIKNKYGDPYILEASSNKAQLCNVNIVEKLRIKVPAEQVVISRLKQLCKEYEIDYIFPQEIQPMTNMVDAFIGGPYGQNPPYNPNSNFNQPMNFNPNQYNSGVNYDNNFPTKSVIDDNPYQNIGFDQPMNTTGNPSLFHNQQPIFNNNPNYYGNEVSYSFSGNQTPSYNSSNPNQINQSFNKMNNQSNVNSSHGNQGQYPNVNHYNQGQYPNVNQNNQGQYHNNTQTQINQNQGNNMKPGNQSQSQFNNNKRGNDEFDMTFPDVKINKSNHDDFPEAPK